jgi:hypothetical protein
LFVIRQGQDTDHFVSSESNDPFYVYPLLKAGVFSDDYPEDYDELRDDYVFGALL